MPPAIFTDETLRQHVLGQLSSGARSVDQLTQTLYPTETGFSSYVEARGKVLSLLLKLKHEHRAWPQNGKWTITSKGQKSYG